MPRISIIMPCRNAAATLPATLDSVFQQDFADWEVIAVDDGSTDDTRAILRQAAYADARVKVIRGPQRGAAAARNAALRRARGGLIAFLDADDLWSERRLSVMADLFARRPEVDIAYSRFRFFTHRPGDNRTLSSAAPGPLGPLDLLRENVTGTSSNLIARATAIAAIGPMRDDMTHGEDREWLVRAAAMGRRIEGVDRPLLFYRTTPGGLSSDLEKMRAGWRESVRAAERIGGPLDAGALRRAEAVYLRFLARRALRLKLPPIVAARYALRGAARSPRGFFKDRWRGGATLGCALINLVSFGALSAFLSDR